MDTAIIISLGAFVITGISTIISIVYGIEQWKAQKRFEIELDIASRLSYLAYKFVDDLNLAQSPVGPYPHEYEARSQLENETEWETRILNHLYAHLLRLDPLLKTLREMKTINWEAKSTIGLDFQPFINKYEKIYAEIKVAVFTAFNPRTQKLVEQGRASKVLLQQIESAQHIVYRYEEGNVLYKQAVETTTELTNLLSKYTFGQAQERTPLWNKFRESVPQLTLPNLVKNSDDELANATKRLSEAENAIRDIDFNSDKNEDFQASSNS